MVECRYYVQSRMPGVSSSSMTDGEGGCPAVGLVQMSQDHVGGKESVGKCQKDPFASNQREWNQTASTSRKG